MTAQSSFSAGGLNAKEIILLATFFLGAVLVAILEYGGVHPSAVLMFGVSSVVLIGLAWALGRATEELGEAIGPRASGIMNATFGNLPELVIVLLLISKATGKNGYLDVAMASIIGSVVGNMLLVLGMAFFAGGLKNGVQEFSRDFARSQVSMLYMAIAGLSIPTLLFLMPKSDATEHIVGLSMACAIVLLFVYLIGLGYFLKGAEQHHSDGARWKIPVSTAILALSAVAVALSSEALVESITGTVESLGISTTFVGFVIVPIVGNIAEHFVAVQIAIRNDINFSITVALGSSVQVAIGLAPIAVLMSPLFGPNLTLSLEPPQILAMVLGVFFVSQMLSDSKSTWLDGLQLMAIYALIGIGFWY